MKHLLLLICFFSAGTFFSSCMTREFAVSQSATKHSDNNFRFLETDPDFSWLDTPTQNLLKELPQSLSPEDFSKLRSQLQFRDPGPENDSDVLDFLKNHKAYVSLTTSPQRLNFLPAVLATLDLSLVEKVFVVLPEKYGRDGSVYLNIPESLTKHPKIEILRTKQDFGPITKIAPTLEHLNKLGREQVNFDGIVVSLDDDVSYPRHLLNHLISESIRNDRSAVGLSAQNLSFWKMGEKGWPGKGNASECGKGDRSQCNVIEGFGGIAYRLKYSDAQKMMKLSALSKACFASDDLVLSFVMAQSGVARIKLRHEVLNLGHIKPYEYGFGEDALHRGGGLVSEPVADINAEKYSRCKDDLASTWN